MYGVDWNMGSIDLVFICNEFGTTDYMPSDKKSMKISDVNEILWKKYNSKVREYVKENTGNVITNDSEIKERNPLTFSLMLISGKLETISYSDDLSEIAERTDTVFWLPFVSGGNISNQKFANHAYLLIKNKNKKYDNWDEIESGNFGSGICTVGPDPDGNVRTWIIKPKNGYPTNPPIVEAEPKFTNDYCFTSGQLDYTKFLKKSGSPWLYFVENFQNPLKALVDELNAKYKFGV